MGENPVKGVRPNGWALLPFLVFAVFYVGLSVWANDFYKVSMPVAFLVASASALFFNRGKSLEEKIDTDKMYAPSFLMVLTGTGDFAYRRKDGVYVIPIGCLKN